MSYFYAYLAVGFFTQYEYILEKIEWINNLEFATEKIVSSMDIILGIFFFPVYLTIDYFLENDRMFGEKLFDLWIEVLWVFLWIPFYFPMSLVLKLEKMLRKM